MLINEKLTNRFWSYVDKDSECYGCWDWIGNRHKSGYGKIWVDGETWLTHRVSWIMFNGEIPDGLCVLHRCDNKSCCNPDHLYLGTNMENSKDMCSKDRQATGEKNGASKLNEEEVILIRELYNTGKLSQRALSSMFHISKGTIYYIVNDMQWKHLL